MRRADVSGGAGRGGMKALSFGLMLAAPFFLFNPEYSIIDPLPDFIGYILIVLALRKLRDVDSHLEAAASGFEKLALVTGVKFLAVFFSFSSWLTESERPTAMLLIAFISGAVELILIFTSGWNSFFEGLVSFSEREGGSAALAKGRRGREITPAVRRLTFVFVSLKAALATLPEMSVLSSHTYDDTAFNFYEYIELFRVLAIFFGLIAGTVWLVAMLRYLRLIKKDAEFFEAAWRVYSENVLGREGTVIRRRIRWALTAAVAAFLFTPDLYVDGYNVIPDALAGLLLVLAFVLLRRFWKKWVRGVVISSVYTAVSAFTWYGRYSFHQHYTDILVQRDSAAWEAFWRLYPAEILAEVIFAAAALTLISALTRLVRDHCGYVGANASEAFRESRLSAIRKSLDLRLRLTGAIAVLTAGVCAVYGYIITFKGLIVGEIWWMICFAVSLALFVSMLASARAITVESDSKYMLD